MTVCDHPSLYKQAHAHLPDSRKNSPQWKVVLYILTSNENLWHIAQSYIRPDLDQFYWQEMLEKAGLSVVEQALVELAGSLYGSSHSVNLGTLCTSLDDHNFEVAMKAIRIKHDFFRGRAPI